jgi:hypothetical protein
MSQQLTELDALSAAAFHDRRPSEPRVVCERAITLLPAARAETGQFITAELTDCSLHGMGLTLPEEIEAGQQILARVQLKGQPTLLMYTIRYCIPTQPDRFRAGARFTGMAVGKFRGELENVVMSLTGAAE